MKKLATLLSSVCLSFSLSYGQIKPNPAFQKHLWNFDDDTPIDLIGEAHGEPDQAASIHNGYLDLSDTVKQEGYLSLPGDVINLKNYKAVSIEVWCLPYLSLNSPNANMLWSFGQYGNPGKNYLFFTPARWGNGVAARISVGDEAPWANEDGLNFSANISDSIWHHYVVTIDSSNIMRLYADGALVTYGEQQTPAIDTLDSNHTLSKISNESAFLGRSVYSPDPTWKGMIELFAIWNTSLSDENILWLYQQGAKRGPIVNLAYTKKGDNKLNIVVKNNRMYIFGLPAENQKAKIKIYNTLGSLMYHSQTFRNGDPVNLKNGIYFAHISVGNESFTVKFIK
ncbi:MAG: T9SS type A sorting domain-containing protein [Bacteroidales bacterium]|nr:T9SS type A sorting domain-containing protein [Bacteroidales bacterium]